MDNFAWQAGGSGSLSCATEEKLPIWGTLWTNLPKLLSPL